ncbi:hypothetical protein [Massilia aquatica]|uniref:Uncharacterized protein n=1 Tax=Massilia aquatica TaxID=2609000 RepID=A0ABX0M6Q6_9BURK|nr:hypothetical protein [Massilia aquatica]NHZ42869.1 hypothetical protein [Massilia aquatica]
MIVRDEWVSNVFSSAMHGDEPVLTFLWRQNLKEMQSKPVGQFYDHSVHTDEKKAPVFTPVLFRLNRNCAARALYVIAR